MPAGPEADHLVRIAHIGFALVVFALEISDIDQHVFGCRFACHRREMHLRIRLLNHNLPLAEIITDPKNRSIVGAPPSPSFGVGGIPIHLLTRISFLWHLHPP